MDPFIHRRVELRRADRPLGFLTARSLFSSHAIDAGTLLLLDHLPEGEPRRFLDLGSGYGALGLAVAARFPGSSGLLADRDLLAVEFSRRNAALQAAGGVAVAPSLGYRDLPAGSGPFDWILANVPARAGEGVIAGLLEGGRARLAPGGEMRIVAIAPLEERITAAALERGLPLRRAARGGGHVVLALPPGPGEDPGDELYERDCVELKLPERLRLVRPSDLADEPPRLPVAVPLLAANLPETPPERVLVFRSGYGLLAALALERYPRASVVAVDRDLLAAAFTARNCAAAAGRIVARACLRLREAAALGPFDLVLGELSPPSGARAALEELEEAREALAPGGRALVLGLRKAWKEFLRPRAVELRMGIRAKRDSIALYEIWR